MNICTTEISEQYKNALQGFLNGEGEPALRTAYELGRRSIAGELSSVELVTVHQEVLLDILRAAPTPEESLQRLRASSQFLIESLSPFEMTIRGYRETLNTVQISEERYRTLIDTARDVIYSLSPDGIIKSLNPVFEAITGYAPSEWIGKSFVHLIHPDDVAFAMALVERVLKGETPPAFELLIKSKSGEVLVGEFTTTPQFEDGEVVGMFGIARDVTQQRKVQEQMRSLAKRVVDAQEDERRRIARELHDDLCQWLSGMKLSLNLLEDNIPGERTLRKKLRALKEEINRKVVDVRRLAVSLRQSALDDFGLLVALPRPVEHYARLYKITITFETVGSVLDHYHHEVETALYRIAQEALSNMGKHSHARKGSVSLTHTGKVLTLKIVDDGVGFSQKKSAQEDSQGHHLGLVSMKERATLLGGVFRIDSRKGEGTRIHVEILMELYVNEEDK